MKELLLIVSLLHLSWRISADINLQDVEIPDIDDFSAIKEKCERLGGNGTYDRLKASKELVQGCLQGFIDFTVLKNEVEEAKKTGSMDEVFGKYCSKRSKVTGCVQNLTDTLKLCLESEEKKALAITLDILKQLGEFVCFRDGDRIAMFVAEGGVECIKDKTEGIKNCVNNTFKITTNINTNSLPNLLIDRKKCDDLGKLQTCVVAELEKCKDSTPANIVDALFRFIKRSACTSSKSKRSLRRVLKREVALTNDIYPEVKNRVFNLIKEKCSATAPNRGYDAFVSSAENATKCLKYETKRHQIFVTPVGEFKEIIRKCFSDLVEKTRDCLPVDEKYWPQFYLDIMYSMLDFVYAQKDKFYGNRFGAELFNCLQNFRNKENKDRIVQCLKDQQSVSDNFDKKAVCGRLNNFRTCISSVLDEKCVKDVEIANLKNNFFEIFTAACTG